jgi:pimeloyl-ACP methyl ester carboxylesterase
MLPRGPAVVVAVLLSAGPALGQETSMVPVTVDGQIVRLQMRIYRPPAVGPVPTLVFNHGSTGNGLHPPRFARPIDFPVLAQFFVQRGWAVVMPARRGRGGSEGTYDEGFETVRSLGYACDPSLAIPGADRALRDIEAAMTAILAMPFVDRGRVVIGGQSRGGILSVAYAGRHPEQVKGVINFVGGWSGRRCPTDVNRTLFVRGAGYPGETIWLYGDGDPFYSLAHSRENFSAFRGAGGTGVFHEFDPPAGTDGHRIVTVPSLWTAALEAYLKRQRLGRP